MKISNVFYKILFLMIIISLSSLTNLFAQIKVDSLIKITNIENAYPFWSPDGNKIVFQSNMSGNWEIYTMDANGSDIIRLTYNSADDMFPVWSPDGSRIAFVSNRDEKTELADLEGNTEIYIMNSDGSDQVNISNSTARELHPNWSPDGSRIIFNTTRDDTSSNVLDHPFTSFEIYSMNVNGSDWKRITNNSLTDTYASWSPDGSKILFRRKIDNNQNSEIFVMNSDGSVPVNVTNHPAFDGWPTWSPDGSKIAFASNRTGTFNIYVMNSDGSKVTQLTDSESPDEDARPHWSKYGSNILFNRTRYGTMDIYMMKVSDNN